MKGIVGRKVGMTQIFDEETGRLTPVTVIQAGPCPVVSVRTSDADGYDAVQLGFEEVPERKLSKGALGHLKKNGVGPLRKLVEIRGPHELAPGDTVTVEAFEPGDNVKVSGISIGKGFQGTIKRHRFHRGPVSHGSHNIRKPGSIGASATPSRVFKGQKMAAPKAPVLGGSKKDVALEAEVFGAEVRPHLVHETVRAELNDRRAGTRAVKSRGLV